MNIIYSKGNKTKADCWARENGYKPHPRGYKNDDGDIYQYIANDYQLRGISVEKSVYL